MKEFLIEGKKIIVYPSMVSNRPVIYFNTFSNEGAHVYYMFEKQKCLDFTLVVICQLDWNFDMSPWKAPSIFQNDLDFTGGADTFLQVLTEKIIPKVETEIVGTVIWRGIAGYSLAGLFAVYSLYQTDVFSRAASISGSLWFPNFKEYVFSHKMKILPKRIYFSLGNKECKTKNTYLKMVQSNTEEIEAFYKSQGIHTIFQLNSGNHYKDAAERSAAGIRWIVQ